MRLAGSLFVLLIAVGTAAGCFDPQIKSGEFTCQPPDHAACPRGFRCVDGLCINGSGPPVIPILDLASTDIAEASDLAEVMSLPDLRRVNDLSPSPMPDLSMPAAPDMAKSQCLATGGNCNHDNNAICCSGYCVYKTEKCR